MQYLYSTALVLALHLVLVGAVPVALAQTGRIAGTVTDAATGESLPGANVVIQGTNKGGATDIEGTYAIPSVPVGTHTLVASYVGYERVEQQVTVESGTTTTVDFELPWQAAEGEEVVITAQAEGQVSAINQQLSSNTIANVVSGARIKELPDVNAAESIGRLPGVSIKRSGGEANKIAIRGLSPKYNNVTVNGVRLPSTDSDNRSVDLSLISSNSLDGIEVKKAITPDMDADAIGGSVDLKLRTAPEGLQFDVTAQGGYTALQDYYGNYKFVGTVSNRFFGGNVGAIANFNIDNYDRSVDMLNGSYRLTNQTSLETADLEITNMRLRDQDVRRGRTGGSLLFDYQLPQGRITANGFYQRLSNDGTTRITDYTVLGDQAIYWNLDQIESTTSMFTGAINIEQDFDWFRYDAGVSRSASNTEHPEGRHWTFVQEADIQPSGGDQVGPEVDITEAQSFVQELVNGPPGTYAGLSSMMTSAVDREENVATTHLDLTFPFRFGDNVSGYLKTGGKLRWLDRANDEDEIGAGGLQYGNNATQFNPQLRCVNDNLPEIDLSELGSGAWGIPYVSLLDTTYSQPSFLDDYAFQYAADVEMMNRLMDALQQCTREGDNEENWYYREQPIGTYGRDYSGIERYQAGYLMAEFNLGQYVTLIPGMRYERDYSRYQGQRYREVFSGYDPLPPAGYTELETERENEFWLPMVHLQVKPTDWLTLRLARTESLSRPDYIQYAPITTIDQYSSWINANNASLRPSHATNYDAALSLYSGRFGLFSVAGFYKSIDDLITWVSYEVNRNFTDELEGTNIPSEWYQDYAPGVGTNINNPYEAEIRGVELEWQTNFWYLPSVLKGLVLSANYSYIESETTYQDYKTVDGDSLIHPRRGTYNQVLADTTRTGRVVDQPSHIANVMFGYDIGGFSTRLSFLYQTDVATNIDVLQPLLDQFSGDYFRVDLTLRQQLSGALDGLEIFANLNNLTSEPDIRYQAGTQRLTYEENYGFTMDLGARYRF